MTQKNNKILVIGGGIGGIRTALDLATAGRDVVLIDKARSIGGLVTQLDRTFPTNNCDLCTLSPQLSESERQQRIKLMAMTQITGLEGEAGNFKITLTSKPRYIDMDKCTACGDCFKEFKECVQFAPGLDHRAPTCMRYPQATPQAYSIDIDKCTDINKLASVCKAGAIIPEDREKVQEIEAGSIILATGADLFNPDIQDNFGGGEFPNVVTGLEYERIMSASGPTLGNLMRPSDRKEPRKIAWIQCVGSRSINADRGEVSYCSSVCCMYALKEAIVTKERFQDDIETVIFYMDMRTSGKDYELYRMRAEDEHGVKFIRSRPHSVVEDSATKNLSVSYIVDADSQIQTEIFDMVVLSTGFRISDDTKKLAEKLEIEVNEHHFVKTSSFTPVETSRPGIYVCGLYESPKDIPETIAQASAAACMATSHLDVLEEIPKVQDELPAERDVSEEEPRIGVFICDCGLNIGNVINVEDIVKYTEKLPHVKIAENAGHGCSNNSMEHIQSVITDQKLNRIVIAGCSPRTHEAKFQNIIRKAGLNKYLLEMANIRDQDTWVHLEHPDRAADKARELIRMAVYGVVKQHPLTDYTLPVNKNILVVGGGITGMNAALCLAEQGFKVYIVEQSHGLGGVVRNIRKTISGEDVQTYLSDLIEKTMKHDYIEVVTNATIVDHKGMTGMFTTGLQVAPQMYYRQIDHGITIMATGAVPNMPTEYLLGEHEAVVTQLELESLIEDKPEHIKNWKTMVMIQCVGSRTPENPNCSKICCQSAVKNALRILEINPEIRIVVLNRDIRTLGFDEDYYLKARKKGVIFAKYEPENKPVVKTDGDLLKITFEDQTLGREIEISAECLALSTGMVADDEATEDLAMIFHLNRTSDGYFLEDHIKLRPVDLSVPGFLVAGTAHGPKSIRESISQAQAAAGRALTFLAEDLINIGAGVAKVESKKCAACLICVRACPYEIPYINADGYSEIDPAKCHGCGVCASECPAKAIQLMQYEDDMISAQLNGLFDVGME